MNISSKYCLILISCLFILKNLIYPYFLAPPSFKKINKNTTNKRNQQNIISIEREIYIKSSEGIHMRPSMALVDIGNKIISMLEKKTSEKLEIIFKDSSGSEAINFSIMQLSFLHLKCESNVYITVRGKFDRLILNCVLDIFEQFIEDLVENQNAGGLVNAYDSEIEFISKLLQNDKKIEINQFGCLKSL